MSRPVLCDAQSLSSETGNIVRASKKYTTVNGMGYKSERPSELPASNTKLDPQESYLNICDKLTVRIPGCSSTQADGACDAGHRGNWGGAARPTFTENRDYSAMSRWQNESVREQPWTGIRSFHQEPRPGTECYHEQGTCVCSSSMRNGKQAKRLRL